MDIVEPHEYIEKLKGKDFDILISAKGFLFDDLRFLEWDIRAQEGSAAEVQQTSGAEYANRLECLSALAAHMAQHVSEFIEEYEREAA